MPETALNRLRQVEPSEGDRFVEHRSTPLLRSGPLAGEILRLRDSGKLFQVFAPSVRAASCAHLSPRLNRIVGVVRYFCCSPPPKLVLLLTDKVAVLLMHVLPAEYFFSDGCG